MLITFEGKGCKNCPFRFYDETPGHDCCSLSGLTDAIDIKLDKLIPASDEKPDGCPLKGFPGDIEISAMEPE